ncbi:MAG: PAS domain S-box protein [Anaerolineae bacterium]|nr:PAS domain S-box protein [Anaerolineae bacterium]
MSKSNQSNNQTNQQTSPPYERLIATSPDGVIANNLKGEIILFNERAEAILGFSADDVLGRHVADIFADARQTRRIAEHLRHAADGTLREYQTEVINEKGEPVAHSRWPPHGCMTRKAIP